MEFTLRQKIEIVKEAKKVINIYGFICNTIEVILYEDYGVFRSVNATDYIPELLDYKPVNITPMGNGLYGWFGGCKSKENQAIRIKVLNKLLRKLQYKLKKEKNMM